MVEILREGTTEAKASYVSLLKNVGNECKHPWDFLRELVSNSYDAQCTSIDMFPHYLINHTATPIASVLISVDDGRGMDDTPRTAEENKGLVDAPRSSIDAFLQLGFSTNTGVNSIGRFCYGSKQIMLKGDAGFMVLTRTARMSADEMMVIDSNHMEHELRSGSVKYVVTTRRNAMTMLEARLDRFYQPSEFANTLRILRDRIANLDHGTLLMVASAKAPFHEWQLCNVNEKATGWNRKDTQTFPHDIELGLFVTSLRFATRHGSILVDPDAQFKNQMAFVIRSEFAEHEAKAMLRRVDLRVYSKKYTHGFHVQQGWPYLKTHGHGGHDPPAPSTIKGKNHKEMTSCVARIGPRVFTDDVGRKFVVVWDQNPYRSVMNGYNQLPRRGHTRTKFESIATVALQPFQVHAQGVRICPLMEDLIEGLPTDADFPDDCVLTQAVKRYFVAFAAAGETCGATCHIHGNFDVEPSRSKLSHDEINGLQHNRGFQVGLANALYALYTQPGPHGEMLRFLLGLHLEKRRSQEEKNREEEQARRAEEIDKCSRLVVSPKTTISDVPPELLPLCDTFFIPEGNGKREMQLQHIISVFAQSIKCYMAHRRLPEAEDTSLHARCLRVWKHIHPTMHYPDGVDSVCLIRDHALGCEDALSAGGKSVEPRTNVEYKYALETSFNHPLQTTDIIVVWTCEDVTPGVTTITDKFKHDGVLVRSDALADIGYVIPRIRMADNGGYVMSLNNTSVFHKVEVVSLRDLILHTLARFCNVAVNPAKDARSRNKKQRR